MKVVGVIPSRYASTRLPGKPLLNIGSKPLIQWVYEAARSCPALSDVLVATDDQRIADAVSGFGGKAVMTRSDQPTGTDRLAEVARGLDADVIVNIQGDEPFIKPETIDAVVRPFADDPKLQMSTACVVTRDETEAVDPNTVKVVLSSNGNALYFSRLPIPFSRDGGGVEYRIHLGLYAYRRVFLPLFASWPPTELEQAEKLEQLRVLEHGYAIRVVEVADRAMGIDTPDDLERARRMIT